MRQATRHHRLPVSVTVDNAVDTTAPTVVGVTPVDGAVDVALDAVVTASFSEADGPGEHQCEHDRAAGRGREPGGGGRELRWTRTQTATVIPAAPLANATHLHSRWCVEEWLTRG